MADQDWESVTRIGSKARGPGSGGVDRERVVKGKSAINAAQRAGAIIGTEKKYAGANTKSDPNGQHLTKVANDPDVSKPKEVGPLVGRAISAARTAKEPTMKQNELAAKVNSTVATIQKFESGKAAPDQALLGKMERVLGVKLRGDPKDIGNPLGAKAK